MICTSAVERDILFRWLKKVKPHGRVRREFVLAPEVTGKGLPGMLQMQDRVNAKRIDAVVFVSEKKVWLVEVKTTLNMTQLGQLLAAEALLKRFYPHLQVVKKVALCARADAQLADIFKVHGIEIQSV